MKGIDIQQGSPVNNNITTLFFFQLKTIKSGDEELVFCDLERKTTHCIPVAFYAFTKKPSLFFFTSATTTDFFCNRTLSVGQTTDLKTKHLSGTSTETFLMYFSHLRSNVAVNSFDRNSISTFVEFRLMYHSIVVLTMSPNFILSTIC